jgi:ABC-type transport system involved in multi-copper enzyme maturation permease subunit
MSAPSTLAVAGQLVRDTFRQSQASGVSTMMLAVTAICTLLCLSVNVSGDVQLHAQDEPGLFLPPPSPRLLAPTVVSVLGSSNPLDAVTLTAASSKEWFSLENNPAVAQREGIETIRGQMTLAFGAISVSLGRERADAVHYLELLLAWGLAGVLGVLLALVWTAGFVPTFLEPSAASVLLAKPVARWRLLLGKYFGVLTFVAAQVALFVVLTWLALGVRTGVWDAAYLWCVPLLLLQFAIFYSASVLIGVVTRSTVACVFGSLLFWALTWGINYGRVMTLTLPEGQHLSSLTLALADAAYWICPKPIDAGLILFNALDAQAHFAKPMVFEVLESRQTFSPQLSILSSLLITGVLLAVSSYEFSAADY